MRIRRPGRGPVLLLTLAGPLLLASLPARAAEGSGSGSLAEASPTAGYRSLLERDWFEAGPAWPARARRTRVRALELGIENFEPAARALIDQESTDDELARKQAAVRLAPDLPLARVALARAYWHAGERRRAVIEAVQGLLALTRHLEASVWLGGSLLVMLGTALVAGALGFMLVTALSVFDDVAHDLGDLISHEMPAFARAALLGSVLLVPVVLGEGALGLILMLFALGVAYGGHRHRMALSLAAAMTVVGMYPTMQLAGKLLTALDADPVASAALATIRGTAGPIDVERLRDAESRGDRLAAHALARLSRRMGRFEEARARYDRLLEGEPRNAVLLANRGNLSFREGDAKKAIELYERAAAVEPSATLMFDLSQAYARAFRMEEFENALARAQALDAARVAELSGQGDTSFVADVAAPIDPIRRRMFSAADGGNLPRVLAGVLAPGRLGRSWLHAAVGFALIALFALWLGGLHVHASRCGRCGRRMCPRCDESMWSSDLCDGCHHLFHRPQATDPGLRMARLNHLGQREQRAARRDLLLSLCVPGAAGLCARRPDLSFLSVLLFSGVLVLVVWRGGVVADPLAVGAAGPLAFVAAAVLMLGAYVAAVATALSIRRGL